MEEKLLSEEVRELKLQVLDLQILVNDLKKAIELPKCNYLVTEEDLKKFLDNQTEKEKEIYYNTWENQYFPSTQAFNPEYEAR